MTTNAHSLGIGARPYNTSSRAGWAVFAAAAGLGLAGDLLLRAWPWGINATIWLIGLCAVAMLLPRIPSLELPRSRGTTWLCAAAAFSLMLAWRASPVLQALNLVAIFLCLGMVAFRTASAAVRAGSITEYAGNAAFAVAHVDVGMAVLAARHLDWGGLTRRRPVPVIAVGRGVAFAVVPVVVFGALFASADVFFRDLVREILLVDLTELASHLLLWALFAWLAGGYLWGALLAERDQIPETPANRWVRFDFIEAGVVFGLVNALFVAFVAVQFRYLFGGADRVASSSTLTYAEYARRGFFELVTVAALVVPFLLFSHWLLARRGAGVQRFYAVLAGLLIALVFVVMASAFQRMRLYQETFGLTELRLYTTAFMVWLVAVFVWLAFTVLRGRRDRFAFGVFVAGLAVVVGLNVLNPDGFIVSRNAAIADGGRPFDSAYALSLSADSVPALVANFDDVPEEERCRVARALRGRYAEAAGDWRSWNWSRQRAADAVASSDDLDAACAR
jgi:hypothetical protein